jgi:hypothetical protein
LLREPARSRGQFAQLRRQDRGGFPVGLARIQVSAPSSRKSRRIPIGTDCHDQLAKFVGPHFVETDRRVTQFVKQPQTAQPVGRRDASSVVTERIEQPFDQFSIVGIASQQFGIALPPAPNVAGLPSSARSERRSARSARV